MVNLRKHLSYANVMSTLAVFLVLGGASAFATGQLSKNSVGTKQIKNGAVTGAKIKKGTITGNNINLSTLGTVPSAAAANSATTAATAENAKSAATAENTNALGGTPASGYVKAQLEALHVIGSPGQPPFHYGCTRSNSITFQAPAFYKDPFDVVHLLGDFEGCTENNEMFVLPAGFRPQETERFVIRIGGGVSGTIRVESEGQVEVFGGTEGSLTGIQFRTN
jgi:hypothetical protein